MKPTYYSVKTINVSGKIVNAGDPIPKDIRDGNLQSLLNCNLVTDVDPATVVIDDDDDAGSGKTSKLDEIETDLKQLDLDEATILVILDNDIDSIEKLDEVEDFQTLENIGKGRAKKIEAAFKTLEENQDE